MWQAEKLAEYRPTLKVGSLVRELEVVHGMGVEALRVFNETRLSLQYYEDVVNNPQVGGWGGGGMGGDPTCQLAVTEERASVLPSKSIAAAALSTERA